MLETIIASAITGGLALIGVIYSNNSANVKMQAGLEKAQAVTDAKIDQLTKEVSAHNNFAQRIPTLETTVGQLKEEVHRLEKYHNKPYE